MLVVVNDNPAMRRARPDLAAIARIVGEARVRPSRSLAELPSLARAIRDEAPELLALYGGDGTIAATLTALHAAYGDAPLPRLALVPAGTMNCAARCFGARGGPLPYLARVVEAGAGWPERRRTTLAVDGRLGFLFGVGLIPNLLAAYDSGLGGAGRRAFSVFARAARRLAVRGPDPFFRPFEAVLRTADGIFARGALTNISAGGIECLPFGLRPYVRAGEREGAFHLVAHDLDARGALREIGRIRAGRGMREVVQGVMERVSIEVGSPEPYNLDGDNHPARARFDLVAGPVVRVLTPPAG